MNKLLTSKLWLQSLFVAVMTLGVGARDLESEPADSDSRDPKPPKPRRTTNKIAFVSIRDGNTDIYVLGRGRTQRLTRNPAKDQQPDWTRDGSRIAFVSDRDGNHEIYVMDASGKKLVRLTEHPAKDILPAWSPDGKKLVFSSNRDDKSGLDLYLMNADGSQVKRLTKEKGRDSHASWSPDGKRIVFYSDRGPTDDDTEDVIGLASSPSFDIYVMRVDGSGVRKLSSERASFFPKLSPNGKKIAFSAGSDNDRDIYVMNSDGSRVSRLRGSVDVESTITWAPDGKLIAFTAVKPIDLNAVLRKARTREEARAMVAARKRGIYVMKLDGKGFRRIVGGVKHDCFDPAWVRVRRPGDSDLLEKVHDSRKAMAIIDRAIKAHGGLAKVWKLSCVRQKLKCKLRAPGGGELEGTLERRLQLPEQFRAETKLMFKGQTRTNILVLNGDKGWGSSNGQTIAMPQRDLAEMREQSYADSLDRLFPLTGKGYKLLTVGETKIDGRAAVGVNVSSSGHRDVTLYFDKETGLLVKRAQQILVRPEKEDLSETVFSDFKEVKGLKHWMTMVSYVGGKKAMECQIIDIEFPEKFDASVFEKP